MAKKSPSSSPDKLPVPADLIDRRIYILRGQKVMLDSDLAELYQVLTKFLNLAVRRNPDRFPEDFMFQLTEQEYESLRLQKNRPRRPALPALCFHRVGRGHAVLGTP
jgi:ORF6N domain